jgi:serine/threonine protein kinase
MSDDSPIRSPPAENPDDRPVAGGLSAGRKVFGRYVLETKLGTGGMGVVWRVRDEELGDLVALKFLPEMVARDDAAVDELKEETRHARRLTHPNIVRVYQFERDALMAAVSMEFVAGITLSKLRLGQPQKVLTPDQLAPLVAQLCTALQYAHGEANVVHRDLKPANLLITPEGRLKVADFGVARSLSDTHTRLTGHNAGGSGTLLYMSPQQLLGGRARATDDIYALGATLYEVLTGRPPFFTGDIVTQVQTVTPPTLAERRSELGIAGEPVPAAWEETVALCLAKDPARRPQAASEVARRLGVPRPGTEGTASAGPAPDAHPATEPRPAPWRLGSVERNRNVAPKEVPEPGISTREGARETRYSVRVGTEIKGPYSIDALETLALNGEILPSTLMTEEGSTEFKPATAWPIFEQVFPARTWDLAKDHRAFVNVNAPPKAGPGSPTDQTRPDPQPARRGGPICSMKELEARTAEDPHDPILIATMNEVAFKVKNDGLTQKQALKRVFAANRDLLRHNERTVKYARVSVDVALLRSAAIKSAVVLAIAWAAIMYYFPAARPNGPIAAGLVAGSCGICWVAAGWIVRMHPIVHYLVAVLQLYVVAWSAWIAFNLFRHASISDPFLALFHCLTRWHL